MAGVLVVCGCSPGSSVPKEISHAPKYQGTLNPINEPVSIRFKPFPKSALTKVSRSNKWTDGKLKSAEKVTRGMLEAVKTSSGISITLTMGAGLKSQNSVVVANFNDEMNFLQFDRIRIDGEEVDLDAPEMRSQLQLYKDLFDSFFPDYKRSGIRTGDIVYDGVLEVAGIRMSFKMVALGLSDHNGRKALVTSLTGKVLSNQIDGNFNGYSLIDLGTGMAAFQEAYISLRNENSRIDGNEMQELNLPPIVGDTQNAVARPADQRLQKIKELLDKGLITEVEAEAKRAEILKDL